MYRAQHGRIVNVATSTVVWFDPSFSATLFRVFKCNVVLLVLIRLGFVIKYYHEIP